VPGPASAIGRSITPDHQARLVFRAVGGLGTLPGQAVCRDCVSAAGSGPTRKGTRVVACAAPGLCRTWLVAAVGSGTGT
jgi:hypothetical protein